VLGEGQQSESDALQRIVTYAATHFASEEALMERFSYPDLADHRTAHSDFAASAQGLVSEHTAGRGPSIRDLAAFMERWLVEHITNFDQPMVEYVRARGLAADAV
jgi:hemerythrin-like metal-binding protein